MLLTSLLKKSHTKVWDVFIAVAMDTWFSRQSLLAQITRSATSLTGFN